MLTVDGGGSERLSGVLGNRVFELQLNVKKIVIHIKNLAICYKKKRVDLRLFLGDTNKRLC